MDCASAYTRILRGRSHGELVHVHLTEGNRARGAQFSNDRGVVGCAIISQHLRSAGARLSRHANDVFDRDGHAAERQSDIHGSSLPDGSILIDGEIGVDLRIDLGDARAQCIQHFARGNLPAAQQSLQVGKVERRQFGAGHSTTFVTMKRLFALRGALLNASSAVNQSRGSSSRKTLNTGTA